jgi:hypothetical protein
VSGHLSFSFALLDQALDGHPDRIREERFESYGSGVVLCPIFSHCARRMIGHNDLQIGPEGVSDKHFDFDR